MTYDEVIKKIDYYVDYYSNPIYSMLRPAVMIDWCLNNEKTKDESTFGAMRCDIIGSGNWSDVRKIAQQGVNKYKADLFQQSYHGPGWETFFEQIFGEGATKADALSALNGQSLRRLIIDRIMMSEKEMSPEWLVACFIYALDYYQPSENHHDDFLWYVASDCRLARCSFIGEKKWADYHLDNNNIIMADDLAPKATRVINGQGCVKVRHRPLLAKIGENWNPDKVNKINIFLDGGKDCHLIIDRKFALAYETDYDDSNVLEGDLVTGDSCMSGRGDEAQEFYGNIDGCYVVRFENDEGEQVARCLMYEYNGIRHFIRLYALRDYQCKAYELLRAEMKEGDLIGRETQIPGLKLSCHFDETTPCMYLDGKRYGFMIEDGELFMVNTEDYSYFTHCKTTGTDSLFDEYEVCRCDHCGGLCQDPYNIDDNHYCSEECARADGYTKCEHCDTWINVDNDEHYVAPNGDVYCSLYCLHYDDLEVCAHCGEVYQKDKNEISDTASIDYFCSQECAENHGLVKDEITGGWTSNYIRTRKGTYVDCKQLIENKEKFNIVITTKKGA